MNNNYFSPVIVKYQEKHLVIVNIAFQSLSLSLYQGFTVSTVTKACLQSFSQKGVQPSFGRPFLEEIQGKFTLSLIILRENKPSGKPVFNIWQTPACVTYKIIIWNHKELGNKIVVNNMLPLLCYLPSHLTMSRIPVKNFSSSFSGLVSSYLK